MFIICLILFVFAGCEKRSDSLNGNTQSSSPPTLTILYQDTSMDAVRGTYHWTYDNHDGTETTIEFDSSAPPELVKGASPLSVSPKSSLAFSFSDKPSDLSVSIWEENQSIQQAVVDNTIVTPELKGYAVYEITGTWVQGTVTYAFVVYVN
jgi:hypothetical protein